MYRTCFFSRTRRHTRLPRDWSSDVCSSELRRKIERQGRQSIEAEEKSIDRAANRSSRGKNRSTVQRIDRGGGKIDRQRSEERRGGKDWGGGGTTNHQ